MISRVVGSILLIIAISIGGGLLSLPVVTAAAGFSNSSFLFLVIWLVTIVSSLFMLEVCLWLPQDTNLVAMAKHTLGLGGQVLTWIFYLLMLYCILCVYISGGTDLVQSIWGVFHIKMPPWVSTLCFVLVLGFVVWHGINLIDYVNRTLMLGKMLSYALLVLILLPSVKVKNLPVGPLKELSGAVMPVIFSFGYAIIIPTLRSYLKGNVKLLRLTVFVGGLIPFVCFTLWNYVVQTTLTQTQLIRINQNEKVISELNKGLSALGNPWVATVIHVFTTICLLTAFLSVSLALSDFISDGIKKRKEGFNKWIVYSLTFLPPALIIAFQPYVFITTVRYTGIFVIVILTLLPTLMVWAGRYRRNFLETATYRVPGGRGLVLLMLIVSVVLLSFGVAQL